MSSRRLDDGGGDGGGDSSLPDSDIAKAVLSTFPILGFFYTTGIESAEDLRIWIIEIVLVEWIIDEIVEPIVGAVLSVIELLVEAVLLLFFGQDLVFGGDAYGIADLLVAAGTTAASIIEAITTPLITQAAAFNASVAQLAASGGPLAPAIVIALWIAELAAVLYAVWSIARVFDLPIINIDGIIAVLWLPLDRLLGVFQS